MLYFHTSYGFSVCFISSHVLERLSIFLEIYLYMLYKYTFSHILPIYKEFTHTLLAEMALLVMILWYCFTIPDFCSNLYTCDERIHVYTGESMYLQFIYADLSHFLSIQGFFPLPGPPFFCVILTVDTFSTVYNNTSCTSTTPLPFLS